MSFWPNGCFEGRSVLIVGGTSGIGAAVAKGFLEEGALITVTGVSEAEVESARGDIPDARAEVLDVRDHQALRTFVGRLGRIDHVVNCAGVIRRGEEHDPEVF